MFLLVVVNMFWIIKALVHLMESLILAKVLEGLVNDGKCMNLVEGATGKDRNNTIGGHKA